MTRPYMRRLLSSTAAATLLCLRQALRQQWFMLTLLPFLAVVIVAHLLPATSQTASYRLSVEVSLGIGSAILFIGIILTASTALPSEVRGKTLQRTCLSPGGRLAALTGRIAAFSILAALAAALGFLATLGVFGVRAAGSSEFANASEQSFTMSAQRHEFAGKRGHGVLWIDERTPSMTWFFMPDGVSRDDKLHIQVIPVVASTVETFAKLTVAGNNLPEPRTVTIKLLDNRPTNVEFEKWPEGDGELEVRIERLPGSSPFGFDIRKNELGSERNGVSLVTDKVPFKLNLLAAWFVLWLKLSFAASLAIFASTFLSAPVAGAFSLLLYLLANMLGFLREFAESIGQLPAHIHAHIHQAPHEPAIFEKAVKSLLFWFTDLYPDLSRFDSADALVWGRAMPLGFLLLALLYFLAYSAILWAASALILRRREL